MTNVYLSPDLPGLSTELFTTGTAIIGMRGSGKTNDAVVMVEQAIRFGVPVVVIDPTGVWYGLKSSADGKSAGLPVYIFGGVHADVPLEATAGPLLARFAVDNGLPMILDLSDLTKGMQRRFVAQFSEALYDLKARKRDPLLYVLDEAPRFVPQQSRGLDPDLAKCVGAVEDILALGRSRGLGGVIIGQRSATVNKNVLTQADNLIAMRQTGPADRKAIDEWIGEKADGEQKQRDELIQNLATLKNGEGYFWSPAVFEVFKRAKFAARTTFDSSRTPKIGERRIEPKAFAAIDLEALKGEIAATVERVRADDPKRLRARIAELEAGITAASEHPSEVHIEVPILTEDDRRLLRTVCADFDQLILPITKRIEQIRELTDRISGVLDRSGFGALNRTEAPQRLHVVTHGNVDRTNPPKGPGPVPRREPTNGHPAFRAGAIRMLEACAQFEKRGLSRAQIAALSKIKKGPTFSTYFAELRAAGFISEESGRVFATKEGIAFLPSVPPKPKSGEEIISRWRGEFRAGAVRMLDIVIDAYPQIATRTQIAEGSGILPGPTFSTYLSELKRAELIDERNGGLYAVVLDLVAV